MEGGLKMESTERRSEILNSLKQLEKPIKGTELAEKFGVSRQVIVQDIALLRAKGEKKQQISCELLHANILDIKKSKMSSQLL